MQRIWRAFGLQPHRLETFKLSTDPDFVAKVRDVVGLYGLHPSAPSCCASMRMVSATASPCSPCDLAKRLDAVTTTSAMARHRCLPLSTSQPGRVIGKRYGRHRANEFRKFLDEIEAAVPDDLDVHLVMDNYATHKTPLIRRLVGKEAALARPF